MPYLFGQGKLRMLNIKLQNLFRYCMKLFKIHNLRILSITTFNFELVVAKLNQTFWKRYSLNITTVSKISSHTPPFGSSSRLPASASIKGSELNRITDSETIKSEFQSESRYIADKGGFNMQMDFEWMQRKAFIWNTQVIQNWKRFSFKECNPVMASGAVADGSAEACKVRKAASPTLRAPLKSGGIGSALHALDLNVTRAVLCRAVLEFVRNLTLSISDFLYEK